MRDKSTEIINETRQKILADRAYFARSWRDRLQGMIGRTFDFCDAMIFERCSAIHTFFMRQAIDVIFLDRNNTVLEICSALRPWCPCKSKSGTVCVVELPPGSLEQTGTIPGDRLVLKEQK